MTADNWTELAMCSGKVRLTHELAARITSRYRGLDKNRTAYRCPVCNHWHIGQKIARKPKRQRQE